jgi:hypothetical protein
MRTERDAKTAVQADKRFSFLIDKNGLNRAGWCACTAAIAQFFLDHHPAVLARYKGASRAGAGTGRRVAGQAMNGGESGGQATGRVNTNPRSIPGQAMVKQTGAGQGTGVATNTSVHSWCGQNFHRIPRWPMSSTLWFQTEEGDM